MEKTIEKKRGLAAIFALCPAAHITALVSALVIAVHLLLRGKPEAMQWLSDRLIHPIHRWLSLLCAKADFSVAELVIGIFAVNVIVYITCRIIKLVRCKDKLKEVYITFASLLSAALAVYGLFCIMWGTYYYGDDFMARSGLPSDEISVAELEDVTRYFAALSNEYSGGVERDENGVCCADRVRILNASTEVFKTVEERFPFLQGDEAAAKGVYFSRVMSYTDFTGFFFPFTGEANVNIDFPPSLFASTVAHELSHQRGVAKEQEANFTAVLVCMSSGDRDYLYSGCLMAYIYLGNALHDADYEAWQEVYGGLNENVLADLAANRAYWAQFDTPVQSVSNTVYEGFLQSYDQTLGLKSYGACVDLLVNYYGGAASEYLEESHS